MQLFLRFHRSVGSKPGGAGRGPEIGDQDVQYAADLAAYFSKGRNDLKCDVIVAKAGVLKKPKGAKPGQVRLCIGHVFESRRKRWLWLLAERKAVCSTQASMFCWVSVTHQHHRCKSCLSCATMNMLISLTVWHKGCRSLVG